MKYILTLLIITLVAAVFRIYSLSNNPPGFYSDEASYAYNAYSILLTGRDEHGVQWPITTEAFGDYKLPVMLYSILISFALLGPSELAARLPGAIYGIATIPILYLMIKTLFHSRQNKIKELIALTSVLILAISPSHIFVSRGTWELTPALFFIIFATWLAVRWLTISGSYIMLISSAISYVLSLYSYNSARVFVPLIILSLALVYRNELFDKLQKKRNIVFLLVTILISSVLLLPVVLSLSSPAVTQRAKYISIFYDKTVESNLFEAIRSDGGQNVKVTQFLHNKPVFYTTDFLRRYLSHFDPNFLFVIGDTFEIFKLQGLGFLPLIALPFLCVGIYLALKTRQKEIFLIFSWLMISPIASAFTKFTPSTSRAMNMIVPLVILTAIGFSHLIIRNLNRLSRRNTAIAIVITVFLFILNSYYIFTMYFHKTPQLTAEKWNDGFGRVVNYVKLEQNQYDHIIISSAQAPSYIFFAWFTKYDPLLFQQQAKTDHTPDQNGLNFTSGFGPYTFTKDIKEVQKSLPAQQKTLLIGFEGELKDPSRIIYSRNNRPVFEIYSQLP